MTLRMASGVFALLMVSASCTSDDVPKVTVESSVPDSDGAQQPHGTVYAAPSCDFGGSPTDPFTPVYEQNASLFVGDNDTRPVIQAETDHLWWAYFWNTSVSESNDVDATFGINRDTDGDGDIDCTYCPDWWAFGRRAQVLVQMYDLLAPIDFPRAMVYLERLRVLSWALLANRDDKRTIGVPPGVPTIDGKPRDDTHGGRVMPAWGQFYPQGWWGTTRWETDPGLSGLFTYPMAAFARRVAERPDAFCGEYRQDAITFTNAVIETYVAFREVDMHLSDSDPFAYYKWPDAYVNLVCDLPAGDEKDDCDKLQLHRGQPIPWNLSLSNLKAMADVATAADSALYQSAPEASPDSIYFATNEAPRLIAKNINTFVDDMLWDQLPDATWYAYWDYKKYKPYACGFPYYDDVCLDDRSWAEDMGHGQFTLQSLVSIWENRGVIDGLLARNGYPERLSSGPQGLSRTLFGYIKTTFLRRIWRYDPADMSRQNVLGRWVDGGGDALFESTFAEPDEDVDGKNGNEDAAGFIGLSQFDPWVWVHARDAVYKQTSTGASPNRREDNHAYLLRYRGAVVLPSFAKQIQSYQGLDFGLPSTWEPITGDFNNDGWTDYARVGATGAWVFTAQASGGFAQVFRAYNGLNFGQPSSWQTVVGDFNGDHRTDYAQLGGDQAFVFYAQADGTFAQGWQYYNGLYFGSDWEPVVGDFNGDHVTDYLRIGGTGAWVFLGKTTGGFTQGFQAYSGVNFGQPSTRTTITGDFNGDGITDYARLGDSNTYVFTANIYGNFSQAGYGYGGLYFGQPSQWDSIAGDFNGDHKVDYARLGDTGAWYFYSTGSGFTKTFQAYDTVNFGLPSTWKTITGDFNGDGRADYARLGATGSWLFSGKANNSVMASYQSYLGDDFWASSPFQTIVGKFNGGNVDGYARLGGTRSWVYRGL